MRLNAYLMFNGTCREAFAFYAQLFGGKIEAMSPHAGTPAEEHVPAEWRDKIMHARLFVDGEVLMGSDTPPEHFHKPQGFSMSWQTKDPAEADRIFKALSEGGSVTMPIEETFWSPRFGMCVDRFGIPWMVNCEPAS